MGGNTGERLASTGVSLAFANSVLGLLQEVVGVTLSPHTAGSMSVVLASLAAWTWSRWGQHVPLPGRKQRATSNNG